MIIHFHPETVLLQLLFAKRFNKSTNSGKNLSTVYDILVELEEDGVGIVIEVKYAKNGDFEAGCREAMEQIERMGYCGSLLEDGMERVLKYGIACYKKKCKVRLACFPAASSAEEA